MALSRGPSFAHLLEAPSRLTARPPELWREAPLAATLLYAGSLATWAYVVAPVNAMREMYDGGNPHRVEQRHERR